MKRVSLLFYLLFGVFVSSFAVANGSKEAAGSDEITIVVMPKLVGIPYFNASENRCYSGLVKIWESMFIYTGPTTPDAAETGKNAGRSYQ